MTMIRKLNFESILEYLEVCNIFEMISTFIKRFYSMDTIHILTYIMLKVFTTTLTPLFISLTRIFSYLHI